MQNTNDLVEWLHKSRSHFRLNAVKRKDQEVVRANTHPLWRGTLSKTTADRKRKSGRWRGREGRERERERKDHLTGRERVCGRERERETGRACPVPPCRLFSQLANHSSEFPHSFSRPVFACAPDIQLYLERTLRGKRNERTHHGVGILLGHSGEKPFFPSFFFFSFPHAFFFSCPLYLDVSQQFLKELKEIKKKKMRINIFSWHFLGVYSALWGLATGAFPSSVQIGELKDY